MDVAVLGQETQAVLSPITIWASRYAFFKYDLRTHSFNISQILIILVRQNLLRSIRPRHSQVKQLQHIYSQPGLHRGAPTPGSVQGLPARAPSGGTQPGLRPGAPSPGSVRGLPARAPSWGTQPGLRPGAPSPGSIGGHPARAPSGGTHPGLRPGAPSLGSVRGHPARAPSGGSQPGLCPGCAAGASPMPLPGRTPPCPTSLANGHLSVLVVLPSLLPLHLCPML